jgi:hypothetical protein
MSARATRADVAGHSTVATLPEMQEPRHQRTTSWRCLSCHHQWTGGATVIENYKPPDDGWGIVIGSFFRAKPEFDQPERDVGDSGEEQTPSA